MIYSSKFFFEKCHDCNCRLNYKNRPSNDISSMIFLLSGNFRCQNFFLQKFWFENYVWTNFRIITKNSVADPAIGFNVVVRAFLKEKRDVSRRVRTQARRAFAPRTLTTKPALLMERCDVRYINIYWSRKIGFRKWIFFGVKEFFFMNFDFKNRCKNEFKDNNEKSCSSSRNRVSHKIDLKAQWPRNGHADSVGVKAKTESKH